jgi:hypothetical protein
MIIPLKLMAMKISASLAIAAMLSAAMATAQNVGIGTTTPTAKLEVMNPVSSTVKISGTTFFDTTQLLLSNRNSINQGTDFKLRSIREQGLYISSASDLGSNTNDSTMVIHPSGRIGIGGVPVQSSAILELKSTNKGILVPRLTTTQRNAIVSPATGLLVFDSNTESFWFRNASGWTELSSGSSPGSEIQDSDGDTRVQTQKTVDDDTIRFTSKGFEIARMTSKTLHIDTAGSVYIGNYAGQMDGGIDDIGNALTGNVGIGRWAGQFSINGSNNVFVGFGAGRYEGGKWNTYIGYNAGNRFVLGSHFRNTFIGRFAGGSSDGDDNIHIGIYAGAYNDGSNNIFIGNGTGGGIQVGGDNGTNNIVLGNYAGPNQILTSSNNILIGNGVAQTEVLSNRLYIHNGASDSTTALVFGKFDSTYLRVNGDLKIKGEVHTPLRTGFSNMVPICYGNVSSTGFIQAGSGNFTVTHTSTGFYQITINSESYHFQQYITVVTPIGTIAPRIACTGSGGGQLQVSIYDITGANTDSNFHFVVFRQ